MAQKESSDFALSQGFALGQFTENLVGIPYAAADVYRFLQNSVIGGAEYGANVALDLIDRAGLDTDPIDLSKFKIADATEEDLARRAEVVGDISRGLSAPFLSALNIEEEEIYTEQGLVKEAETIAGATGQIVGEIGSYLVPGTAVAKGAKAAGAGKLAAPTAGVAASEQLITDPNENLFNIIEDIFPEASKNTILEYMAADPDDDDATNRMKMLIQDVGLVPLVERGISFLATLKRMKQSKSFDQMTEDEQIDVAMRYFEDARREAKRKDISDRRAEAIRAERTDLPTEKEVLTETPEGIEQVAAQGGKLKRLARRFFSSEGYFTPQAYNAFRDSQYAQRQTITAAENIANRLNIALKNVADATSSKEMSDRVQEALKADSSFIYEIPKEERLEFFRTQFKLTEDVAREVVNARELMDGLSRKIVGSKGFSAEVKESVRSNVGNYMRRSYRMFEDPAYKPTSEVKENAIQFLADDIIEASPDIDIDEAVAQATAQVDKILSRADDAEVVDYLAQVRRVSKFKQKKDIPEPIRALLGEVTTPSESIILSVAKASRVYEVNNFYRQFNELGKSGGYLSSTEAGRNTARITGTNSILDGKYTTPEMLQALERKEEAFTSVMEGDNPVASFLRNFATLKGLSQQSKTVYSHTTHLRNFLGGIQFGIANGSNPFSRKGLKPFTTLTNNILNRGDAALDAAYEKYLRLGLINTNVKVNEFRALLETGMEREPSTILKKLEGLKYSESIPGARAVDTSVRKVGGRIADIYVATDDFFKISSFANELDTLKRAFPDVADDVLEIRAAQIVQDTLPNYDKVPKGIKALRDMPIGNFVSFPAEIARTSVKIVKQASEEINSGNTVLRNRGLKRLAGFGTTAVGFNEAAKASMDMLGWTEEEQRAHTDLAEGSFNKDSNKLWRMDEDGQLYFVDTRFLDSYEFIKRPVMIGMDRINQGVLRGDDLDEFLLEAATETAKSLLEPFASQEMITEAVLNSGSKLLDGRIELADFVGDVLSTFIPGGITSVNRYVEALNQEPTRITGEPRNAKYELIANLTGVRFTKYEPEKNMEFAISDYKRMKRGFKQGNNFDFKTDPDRFVEKYRRQQEGLYKAQQEMFKTVNAYVTLYGREEAMKILVENGLSRAEAASLVLGQFKAEKPLGNTLTVKAYESFYKASPELAREKVLEFRSQLGNIQSEMNGSSLYTPDYRYSLKEDRYRQRKAKGGEVLNVPNASVEPDQRIDKMTGMPYDQQAGTAFVDEEDPLRRMGFVGGGNVDPLRRLGFGKGGGPKGKRIVGETEDYYLTNYGSGSIPKEDNSKVLKALLSNRHD